MVELEISANLFNIMNLGSVAKQEFEKTKNAVKKD